MLIDRLFSVDVLAFATRWSINTVPGLNNVAVERCSEWSGPKAGNAMDFNLTLVSTFQR